MEQNKGKLLLLANDFDEPEWPSKSFNLRCVQ